MSNLYQKNFNKNISINQRSKRFRHVTAISGRNLQIPALKFNVWLTFHSFRLSSAFYITDKKENDTNPKFNLNINKLANSKQLASKECVIRLWYSDLGESPGQRLNLLMEVEVNLDSLIHLNSENLKYSIQNFNNLLIFEIFGCNFCEPLGLASDEELSPAKILTFKQKEVTTKNSYSLNLMVRLHDFQRVIHETLFKINQLKNTSMVKFEASSRLRALQVRREELLQKINLYKLQLDTSNRSIDQLTDYNESLRLITNKMKEKLTAEQQRHQLEMHRLNESEKSYHNLVKINQSNEFKLKQRQKSLITELASIFFIEKQIEIVPSSTETNLHTKNRMKILSLQFKNLNNNLANSNDDTQNSIILGYVTHAIQVLNSILNVPLRYPIIFRGSKSFIIEQIKEDNVCELPLFKQNTSGAQDMAYTRGVELLNKNLAQLRGLFDGSNYKNIDQKDMLANLKWIFDYFSF